jgi:hypothetical protein
MAAMARENLRLRADIATLASILAMCEALHQPPERWKEQWSQARETPAYRKIAEQYEPQLTKLETLADENEVREILRDFPAPEQIH